MSLLPLVFNRNDAIFNCSDCDFAHVEEEVFYKYACNGESNGIELRHKQFICVDCHTQMSYRF